MRKVKYLLRVHERLEYRGLAQIWSFDDISTRRLPVAAPMIAAQESKEAKEARDTWPHAARRIPVSPGTGITDQGSFYRLPAAPYLVLIGAKVKDNACCIVRMKRK